MKINNLLRIMFVFCVLASNYSYSQSNKNKQPLQIVKYNSNVNTPFNASEKAQINEVYGEKAQEDVYNHPQRVKDIKNILRNRIEYKLVKNGEVLKECPLLSEVPLFDYYKPNISREIVFNPETFNPLKYNFNFYTRGASIYKVDNTNFYIIIKSQHQ